MYDVILFWEAMFVGAAVLGTVGLVLVVATDAWAGRQASQRRLVQYRARRPY